MTYELTTAALRDEEMGDVASRMYAYYLGREPEAARGGGRGARPRVRRAGRGGLALRLLGDGRAGAELPGPRRRGGGARRARPGGAHAADRRSGWHERTLDLGPRRRRLRLRPRPPAVRRPLRGRRGERGSASGSGDSVLDLAAAARATRRCDRRGRAALFDAADAQRVPGRRSRGLGGGAGLAPGRAGRPRLRGAARRPPAPARRGAAAPARRGGRLRRLLRQRAPRHQRRADLPARRRPAARELEAPADRLPRPGRDGRGLRHRRRTAPGQRRTRRPDGPTFGPSERLDLEAELGFVVGVGSTLGRARAGRPRPTPTSSASSGSTTGRRATCRPSRRCRWGRSSASRSPPRSRPG